MPNKGKNQHVYCLHDSDQRTNRDVRRGETNPTVTLHLISQMRIRLPQELVDNVIDYLWDLSSLRDILCAVDLAFNLRTDVSGQWDVTVLESRRPVFIRPDFVGGGFAQQALRWLYEKSTGVVVMQQAPWMFLHEDIFSVGLLARDCFFADLGVVVNPYTLSNELQTLLQLKWKIALSVSLWMHVAMDTTGDLHNTALPTCYHHRERTFHISAPLNSTSQPIPSPLSNTSMDSNSPLHPRSLAAVAKQFTPDLTRDDLLTLYWDPPTTACLSTYLSCPASTNPSTIPNIYLLRLLQPQHVGRQTAINTLTWFFDNIATLRIDFYKLSILLSKPIFDTRVRPSDHAFLGLSLDIPAQNFFALAPARGLVFEALDSMMWKSDAQLHVHIHMSNPHVLEIGCMMAICAAFRDLVERLREKGVLVVFWLHQPCPEQRGFVWRLPEGCLEGRVREWTELVRSRFEPVMHRMRVCAPVGGKVGGGRGV
ncbi:hypothetical protein P154DRAFT_602384 [Amniculicola lignicola CBS 123094]|uniref:Uncharacterized protein n=1 Tax=Amniculicola lignicola CBS 123094 TaxID=1392246 RepID=A0A6A5WFC7_9PLEO|nr:hypothetical protein P154DRAFT_602384 [Amniculicola lignicola CBS 123094]